jgi:sulfopyruvate decarboxylase TPP-binding subunit
MISAQCIAAEIARAGITHVVWLPDSLLGTWEGALQATPGLTLVRVCREGEAWALAAGLWIGGAHPLVVMQNTGLFESGDSLRNAWFDLALPLYALIGYRSYLIEGSKDTARRFTEPVLQAWGVDHVLLREDGDVPRLAEHMHACAQANRPGVALIAEGRG